MIRVLLVHDDKMPLPYYRLSNYGYLRRFLSERGYELGLAANGIQAGLSAPTDTPFLCERFGFGELLRLTHRFQPDACLAVIPHSRPYFFPYLLSLRAAGIKAITWTHGVDLQRKHARVSKLIHDLEHALCDGIILYAEPMRQFISKAHQRKTFVANNTLNLTGYRPEATDRAAVLRKHGIATSKNVIFVGRIQRRKRIDDLLRAFERLADDRWGLVLVGPDDEGILARAAAENPRIFPLGPLYGNEALDLLTACDVACIPGAVGLGIVDAMYCGLPVVTERVDHGPEIAYFHEGVNGFMVDKGDDRALADSIRRLFEDEELRARLSRNARREIETNGHIDTLCRGVLECLDRTVRPDKKQG
jgi:glycosyltransferase involved in cell wall biosynthesis